MAGSPGSSARTPPRLTAVIAPRPRSGSRSTEQAGSGQQTDVRSAEEGQGLDELDPLDKRRPIVTDVVDQPRNGVRREPEVVARPEEGIELVRIAGLGV